MSESFITQCPHCGTSFRVRDEQLSVANGSVRCGACLQVFSARNHVVQAERAAQAQPQRPAAAKPAASKPVAKPATAPAAKPTARPTAKPAARPAPPPAPPPATDSDFAFTADDDDEFLFADGDDDEFLFSDDGDSLFDDDEKSSDGFGELSDSFMQLNHSTSEKSRERQHFADEAREMSQDILDDKETDDESWAESILEEIEAETKPAPARPADFSKPAARVPQHGMLDFDEPVVPPPTPKRAASASAVVSRASQELDVDFDGEERLSRLRPLGWLLILLLLVTLFGQLAWLQRDTYARMDQWRGLYQQACDLAGCTLPEQIDLDAIRTSVLVREHKDSALADLRMVDIVLTNRAPFKQNFPELVLQYTDAAGKLVADQSFRPADYLRGEMTGVQLMPINTRIYISVPIRRPPAGAVNYQLVLKNPVS